MVGTRTSDTVKIIQIKQSVFENNNVEAENFRSELKRNGTFFLNLMSSPGSGKTSLILRTIEALKSEVSIGILEADIESVVDAEKIAKTGVAAVQLHTGGMCHLDAYMTRQGADALGATAFDLVILENIGNLVCPAEFDTGASANAMILSVPEGDDKPLKYPLMFSTVRALVINKIDTLELFDFDIGVLKERVKKLNPQIAFFEVCAKTGEGIEAWASWLQAQILSWKS